MTAGEQCMDLMVMDFFSATVEEFHCEQRQTEWTGAFKTIKSSSRINHIISMKYMLSAVLPLFSHGNQPSSHC